MLLEASQEAGALPFMLLDRRLVGARVVSDAYMVYREAPRANGTLSSGQCCAQCPMPHRPNRAGPHVLYAAWRTLRTPAAERRERRETGISARQRASPGAVSRGPGTARHLYPSCAASQRYETPLARTPSTPTLPQNHPPTDRPTPARRRLTPSTSRHCRHARHSANPGSGGREGGGGGGGGSV